ncbi:MAG TPA: outer membrane beta-barrel protein [Bacteroidales bacterium]|nr:outer membrane beta-barrel protein [Bacteroidales bacterium]HOK74695.1 outer membrane beta-barrel protein [Bacteroidales bacterium]HPP93050.1 outer membrane beta-barrel protein [Bacteroidales bacterium]HRR16617.1 outer membrane beta-barrel protein [Bacteroidales bacterium]
MRDKVLISVFIAFGMELVSFGQDLIIKIQDGEKEPLPGAVVQLVLPSMEKIIQAADNAGIVSVSNLNPGKYGLKITFVGFQPLDTVITVKSGRNEYVFVLSEESFAISEIVVSARRPMIKQEEDKMIIDIESVASISTNTLEVLESTPGLIVDQDGGIYLSSATPAMILINGREQKMSGQDIMTLLRSLPPGSVLRIEVMRTPSAKYSASSSGGIVNIILKKGMKIGRFGSIRTGMNQGRFGNRFAGFSINNSGEYSTGYLNMELSHNDMLEELNSTRLLRPDTTLYQSSETRRQAQQGYIGYGVGFDAGKKMSLNYDGRLNGSLPRSSSVNSNIIKTAEGIKVSETVNNINNKSSFINLRQEFGALYRIDTAGSEIDTRFSYGYNRSYNSQNYSTSFLVPSTSVILGDGQNEQQRHFLQLQSDFAYRLPYEIKFEAGYSGTYQNYFSNTRYYITSGDIRNEDLSRTGRYRYREHISSLYIQVSRELLWRILLKSGIRMEHTFMEGLQKIPMDTSFVVRRADWFPYLYLSRPVVTVAGFEVRAYAIYRRTIARPGYENLNPSVRYVDQFFYETGNPGLKPQFTTNMELNISVDDLPVFAWGINKTENIFSSVVYRDSRNMNIAVRTYDNLGKNRETYFRIAVGIPPTNIYFFYAGAQYNRNIYDGFYEGAPLSFDRGSWRFFTYHSLNLTRQTRLTMNGYIITKGQMNLYEINTFGQLNFGLNQTFFNRKLSLTLSARDILCTMVNEFSLQQGNINTTGKRYSDTRRFGINIIWNFGIPEKKEKEKKIDIDMDV